MNSHNKNYEKYLKSSEWKNKRKHIAEINHYICENCHKIIHKGFHIHHKTYKRFGNELDKDLMFLCEDCHNKLHYRLSKKKNLHRKKKKFLTCENCLGKISYSYYYSSCITQCPYCHNFIGRPNKYGRVIRDAKFTKTYFNDLIERYKSSQER